MVSVVRSRRHDVLCDVGGGRHLHPTLLSPAIFGAAKAATLVPLSDIAQVALRL